MTDSNLDFLDGITHYEYRYLKGDRFLRLYSAEANITVGFCNRNDLGKFGRPTERGLRMMAQYESENDYGQNDSLGIILT